MNLKGKTIFISGASRGIGKAIALRAAQDGAYIRTTGNTVDPHPKLEGTIHTAAEAIEKAGGKALAIQMDIRDELQIKTAVEKAVEKFGGIDILINNASAISLRGTLETSAKRYDLMHQVNVRGTFLLSQACIPHLQKSENPHILNLAPPPSLESKWFSKHFAYTQSKMGMSLCVLGMAEEFPEIAVNALWPKTVIATAAVQNILGGTEMMKRSRKPKIVADAAHAIVTKKVKEGSGQFLIDEEVLQNEGITDFDPYAVDPTQELILDLFL